jgi:hypothetical protein
MRTLGRGTIAGSRQWQEDMAPCDYFGPKYAPILRAVGWLEQGRAFREGEVDRRVFERLCEFVASPWQPATAAGPPPLRALSLQQRGPRNGEFSRETQRFDPTNIPGLDRGMIAKRSPSG